MSNDHPGAVAAAPVAPQVLLPALRALVAEVAGAAVAEVEAQGRQVSCAAGCGACCRQLVPISDVEAQAIADLVERLPPDRRATVTARFAEAERRIAAWQPLDSLLDADIDAPPDEQLRIAAGYFRLGIPCPFLEDESCSIYPDRPLLCREYLVTSPAAHCARQYELRTDSVRLTRPSWSLARLASDETPPQPTYVPLTLALHWQRERARPIAPQPLAVWVARFEAASRLVAEKLAQAEPGAVVVTMHRTTDGGAP